MLNSLRSWSTSSLRPSFGIYICIYGIFFTICFGLGYATCNRYDPRVASGLSDTREYYALVEGSPKIAQGHHRYRVLTPFISKPLARLAKGRVGSFNPVFFALLLTNSMFVSTTMLLLVILGLKLTGDARLSMLGVCLYALNFTVANGHLVGLVDAAENCFLLLSSWAMTTNRWWMLPIIAVPGALNKETFVPLSIGCTGGWIAAEFIRRCEGLHWRLIWIAALCISGLVTVVTLHSIVDGHIVTPWSVAEKVRSNAGIMTGFIHCFDREFLYVFFWLLPLGLYGARYLPLTWSFSSGSGAVIALILGSFADSRGNVARAMFNVAGPLLSIGVALTITDWLERAGSPSINRRPCALQSWDPRTKINGAARSTPQ